MCLTNQQREVFVKLIDSGKNTYKDIHSVFPFLSNEDIINLIGDRYSRQSLIDLKLINANSDILLFFIDCPDDFHRDYQFNDSDAFVLSIRGKNILYKLQKEEVLNQKTDATIKWAKYATWFSAASVIATLAIGIISVYISLSH